MIFWALLICGFGVLGWIRFAPSDPDVWHVDPKVSANQDLAGGVRRRLPNAGDEFTRLHAIILATPRTEVLSGAPGEGRVTYVTRSRWMGFPDYTTVQAEGTELQLFARLRFGKSDMGVNRARVESWLSDLRQLAQVD